MLERFKMRFAQFMVGRYGMDQMSRAIFGAEIAIMVLNLFLRIPILNTLVLAGLAYLYFRMFSRNISARYQENQKFLMLQQKVLTWWRTRKARLKDMKSYHIYTCPNPDCKAKIRIPRGKGKIIVTCPKCRTEFEKKS